MALMACDYSKIYTLLLLHTSQTTEKTERLKKLPFQLQTILLPLRK